MGFETINPQIEDLPKHTLWDIPMGFETIDKKKHTLTPRDYETSLWDLKLALFSLQKDFWHIMRHPYGIWNSTPSTSGSVTLNYETSLWDLKRSTESALSSVFSLWDIPMGFETTHHSSHTVLPLHYETSLWDLKHSWFLKIISKTILWDIPMGFETWTSVWGMSAAFIMRHPYGIWNRGLLKIRQKLKSLWDIPMGFETPYTEKAEA